MQRYRLLAVLTIAGLMSACAPAQRSGVDINEIFAVTSTDRPPLVGNCGEPERDSWRILVVVADRQAVPWWASQSLFMQNTVVGFQAASDPSVRATGVMLAGQDLNWVKNKRAISEAPGSVVALFCCPMQFCEEITGSGITAEDRHLDSSTLVRLFAQSQGGWRWLTDTSSGATSVGQLNQECEAGEEPGRSTR